MGENRRYILNQHLDISQILAEAKLRWLRPNEVCEILRNYQRFIITPDPPYKPSGGSLFLFDRKALRYFRKDGHNWRKKKDGKTVREAHEKLKAGSVDVLHCYYAHGEDNENFQRRCYWMLDTQLEHIVLVHYREIKEGNRSGISHLVNADLGAPAGTARAYPAPSAQVDSTGRTIQASYASSPSTAEWNGQTRSSEFEDVDSRTDQETSSSSRAMSCSRSQNSSLHSSDIAGFPVVSRSSHGAGFRGGIFDHDNCHSLCPEAHCSIRNIGCMPDERIPFNQPERTEAVSRLTAAALETCSLVKDELGDANMVLPDTHFHTLRRGSETPVQECPSNKDGQTRYVISNNLAVGGAAAHIFQFPQDHNFQLLHLHFQNKPGAPMLDNDNDIPLVEKATLENESHKNGEARELKKLDSFGRWMNEEIGVDCEDSLMASDSGNYWNTLDTQKDDKEVSSLSRHMQLDIDSPSPSLSHDQLFSIRDFSPDWAFSGVETKVLITGSFLRDQKHLSSKKWCCMFGEVEVPAEILTDTVLRCQAPVHSLGRVPFYITCSNRLACSEVREFEYRENASEPSPLAVKIEGEEEASIQVRMAKMLYLGLDRELLNCSVQNCVKCALRNVSSSFGSDEEKEWGEIEEASVSGNRKNPKDALIEKLLKDRLYEWLVSKIHEGGRGANVLDAKGQGVIHLAASLGYGWAMAAIVAAGVSPNFRDAQGRTGLHWAAHYGREETVVALVKLGAAPGAVEDPTSKFPGGRTAADLASSRGHKGIAGYLAEADLTSHLSLMTIKESVIDSVAASIAAEKAIETVEEQSIAPDQSKEGLFSMRSSREAVKKSAQAADLIKAAFARSFHHKKESVKIKDEISEIPADIVTVASFTNKVSSMNHFTDYLHSASAALKIQHKYRGWKARKDFLKIRNRIVKIQAVVRGHQARTYYKKVLWSVGIVEKVILRWRRKGPGFRGFCADKSIGNTLPDNEKIDEYDFLREGRKQKVAGVEKALARVQSMARYPESRDQYMRLKSSEKGIENENITAVTNHD
ncbi:calmodulin-binding transcription activator 3-like isoform X1 [Papaver somniferum]|uniref:calmodulin-binding transcription activator 3-like isoform X1 n=1 Tax=Papaver somniferum TaxID=3469 RepID=UPI000E701FC8|nr:calmodulin-binding transcription activator 3-like isoform X1 [Papaver somniferum]